MIHDCKDMTIFLDNPEDPISYNPIFREYYIPLPLQHRIITFCFCPWCGIELPTILRSDFFDTLEKEFGIETNIAECKEDKRIPSEFKTDEWWKKRGL